MEKLNILILAAGMGTRMKSETPKVLHEILRKPILFYILDSAQKLQPEKTILVLGHRIELVREKLRTNNYRTEVVLQKEQLGTAHAVKCAFDQSENLTGNLIILPGDCPLLNTETISKMYSEFIKRNLDVMVLGCRIANPFGYGRIITNISLDPEYIIEEKEANESEKKVDLVNSSIYCVKTDFLKASLNRIKSSSKSSEFYLTDIIRIGAENKKAGLFEIGDEREISGINNRFDLAKVTEYLKNLRNQKYLEEGVTMIDPSSVFIEENVIIGNDTTIYPFVYIKSGSRIGKNVVIGPFAEINGEIKEGTNYTEKIK